MTALRDSKPAGSGCFLTSFDYSYTRSLFLSTPFSFLIVMIPSKLLSFFAALNHTLRFNTTAFVSFLFFPRPLFLYLAKVRDMSCPMLLQCRGETETIFTILELPSPLRVRDHVHHQLSVFGFPYRQTQDKKQWFHYKN